MKCKVCGKEEEPHRWTNENELIEHQMCFNCNFWREKLELDSKRPEHTWAVIDGVHYYLEPPSNSYFQGFGGTKFKIRFNDGFETVCSNMWCQGDVPYIWREKFPDNATFSEGLHWIESDSVKRLGNPDN